MLLAWLALLAAHAQDSQRAAAAKQGGVQNVTVATSTRSSVRRKRTVVTSTKVCSAVEVVHATVSARRQSSASTYAPVVSQCHKLQPDVFWECGRPREWLQVSACDKRAPASLEGAYFSFRCEGSTPRANERCSSSSADSLPVAVMQAHRPCTDHAFVAKIRDAQMAALALEKVAYATNADHGAGCNIHPPAKQFCGERLGNSALALVYGRDISWKSPTFASATRTATGVRVEFNDLVGDLQLRAEAKALLVGDVNWKSVAGAV